MSRLTVLALVALVGWSGAVQAQPYARASLEWTRGEGAGSCPSAAEVRSGVESVLQRSVFADAEGADLSVRGTISQLEGGWRVELGMWGSDGELGRRDIELEGAECADVRDSVVLVVALALDSVVRASSSIRVPAPATDRHWQVQVGLEAMAARGFLTGTSLAGNVWTHLRPPSAWWSLEGSARLWAPETVGGSTRGANISSYGLEALFCVTALQTSSVSAGPCGGARVDVLFAEGFGFDRVRSSKGAMLSGVLTLSAGITVGPLVARFSVAGVAPIIRDRIVFLDSEGQVAVLSEPWYVIPELRLAIGVQLP